LESAAELFSGMRLCNPVTELFLGLHRLPLNAGDAGTLSPVLQTAAKNATISKCFRENSASVVFESNLPCGRNYRRMAGGNVQSSG
jgi:hypothetical protein